MGDDDSSRDDVDRDDSDRDTSDDRATDSIEGLSDAEAADPFEQLGAPDPPDDRDPFAEIDEGLPDSDDVPAESPSFDELGFERLDEANETTRQPGSDDPGPASASVGDQPADSGVDDPFDRLGRGPRDGDPFDGLGEVDGPQASEAFNDELWDDLSRSVAEPETEQRGARRFAEVNKHSYCENCEHFSEPPDIECAHEGTDIVEFVDFETVRVADCPIVAEREALAEMDAE